MRPEDLGLDRSRVDRVDDRRALEVVLAAPDFAVAILSKAPEGWSELETLERVAAIAPRLPVLLLSEPQRGIERLTELKKDAMRALAAGVAHDLNNMLGVIASYASVLLEELPSGDPRRDDAAQILGASERARATTDQLLAFSRRRPILPEVVDVSQRLASRCESLRRHLGETIDFRETIEPGLLARLDPSQLDEALLQLILNANDAMPRGGPLRLEARSSVLARGRTCRVGALRADRYIEIELVDLGTGMTPEVSARIFEPFFSHARSGKGRGLGLNVVEGFAEGMGGAVDVETTPGRGTRVCLYLPRWSSEAGITPAE